MKKLLTLFFLLSSQHFVSLAQTTPVWSTDVAPILYNKCATCHRQGGIAPNPLITYNDAVSISGSISANVQSKKMPPWPPDPYFNRMAHERILSQAEIDKIVSWANNGTPQGNPGLAPPVPTFNNNGDLPGTPDLNVKIPLYTSTATTGDVYQCFVIPSGLSAERYISAFEAIPGNRSIVHHVLVYADTTGACAALDAADPNPGYVNFGGVGSNSAILLGGWVPGTSPITLPTGFGLRLPKNADIVIQIHYPGNTLGQKDSTSIHFFFTPTNNVRNVRIDPILNHQGGALCSLSPTSTLIIPANQQITFTETSGISSFVGNISLLGVAPHMHLIGRNISVFGITPTNDTQKYIRINNWDFQWQGFYLFRKLLKVPQGTTLYSNAFYDNTTANPRNPSSPPKTVTAGEATTDEMMLTFFVWTYYQNGDENIVIDTTTLTPLGINENYYSKPTLFAPYPNPAKNEVYVKFYNDKADKISIDLFDVTGKHIAQWINNEQMGSGYFARPFSLTGIATGNYFIKMKTSDGIVTEKLTVE
ncbi:MAG: T9SS type A sorting domain-containing protein [Bacteroidetes bacterium]|nr:T9SS type A sorting domain-containing protein [Bacteroidota bacterium]